MKKFSVPLFVLATFSFQPVWGMKEEIEYIKNTENKKSLYKQGITYLKEEEIEGNAEKEILYLTRSAKLGNVKALNKLRILHLWSDETEKNIINVILSLSGLAEGKNKEETYKKAGDLYFNNALLEKNFKKSIQYMKISANLANEQAAYKVGVWYLKDGEVKKNYEEALTYLSISANLKSEKLLETVQEVSDFYFYTSVLEDNIEYMKTSAALGNENALYALGVLYLNGDKVERNVPKALLYLEKLALEDIEDPDLLSNLGYVYLEGKEVKQNIPKAVLYFEKAGIESIEDPNLLSILGYLYLKGKGGEKNIEKALPYLEKAAEMGNTDALQDLSILYINGDGVEKDIKKALFYIKNLSLPNIEDIHLLYFIGHSYFKGKEVKKNLTEALPYLEKAAEMGNKKALQDLSILHITTDGVEKDVKKALFNIEKIGLENIKNSTLLYNLGRIYFEGKEVEKNVKKALWYLEKAAGMGNRNALKDLSIFYINTDGIEKSIHKAVWYLKQLENIEDQNL